MELVVEIGAVVTDDHQTRDRVMRGCPHCGVSHEEVAVTAQSNGHAATPFEGQCGADGDAWARPDAAPAVEADVIERMTEVCVCAVPAERKACNTAIDAARCVLERFGHSGERQRRLSFWRFLR